MVTNDNGFKTIKCRTAASDGVSITFPVELCDSLDVNFVIDTGSCATIISTAVYNKIPDHSRPELEAVDSSVRLEVADDGLLALDGQCEITFATSGQSFKHTVYIAPIREDGLIGMDFLMENDYQLSAKSGLKLNGKKCRTFFHKTPLRAVRVTVGQKVKIPANSECLIPGEAINLGDF